MTGKKLKKLIEEVAAERSSHIEAIGKDLAYIPMLDEMAALQNLKSLTLSHNKIECIPENIAALMNLESLNVFNNRIEEVDQKICLLINLHTLNLGMNRLVALPAGFGALPKLQILDLTYNNLNEKKLPNNFFNLVTLRALYLSDNDFEVFPSAIAKLQSLEILALRDNNLIQVPHEIALLPAIKELHLQGNRLTVLPPSWARFSGSDPNAPSSTIQQHASVGGGNDNSGTTLSTAANQMTLRIEDNPWVDPIMSHLQVGPNHVLQFIGTPNYKVMYEKHIQSVMFEQNLPPKLDKSRKISRRA